jgi:hypothetical protein
MNAYDASGNLISDQVVTLNANGHTAFQVPIEFPATKGQLGLVQFSSTNGAISCLGLRFSPAGTFTSIPATITAPIQQ